MRKLTCIARLARKWLMGAAFALGCVSAANAANTPLLGSSPNYSDPAAILGTINTTILSIDNTVSGVIGALPAPVTTSGTSAYTLFSQVLPGALLNATGQYIKVHAWGVNTADANAKTLTFNFGASNLSAIVTGSGNYWDATFIVYKTGASTQTADLTAMTGTTLVTPAVYTNGTVTDTAAITVTVQGTAATSGTMTLDGLTMEVIR